MDILNFTYNTWILLGLFAVSLNSIGISYKVGYSVAIALRYIPDIQRDYHSISQAQQARGVELGINEHFFARLKNSVNILLPLILTSLNRIDTISNAMELRGFAKTKNEPGTPDALCKKGFHCTGNRRPAAGDQFDSDDKVGKIL